MSVVFSQYIWIVVIVLMVVSCQSPPTQFELIDPGHSGVDFQNTILETDSLHYFNHYYIYMGAGVGVGDFNHDGYQDLFFSGNMFPSKLYLNRGNLEFEDVTSAAGIHTSGWITGVSIVDVNQDGWDDIYLCVAGYTAPENRRNLLYVNKGNQDQTELTPEFIEMAIEYGLDDTGHSTQAAFWDYDLDGDLDMYLASHAMENYMQLSKLYTYKNGEGPSTDRLYQNTSSDSLGHPFFRNVSRDAGILQEGYALGLCISDLNNDGWPDVYVANDFMGNDLMYINQQDGTFINELSHSTSHTSQNGMGVDIADINQDGWMDILVLDMLPRDNARQKTMTAEMNYDFYRQALKAGFSPQFVRNTLQLNQGVDQYQRLIFNEIGRMAGVYQTDWSWAPLISDFDGDGYRDIYITNGFRRDVTNHDFQWYHDELLVHEQRTGAPSEEKVIKRLHQLDSVYLPNVMYRRTQYLKFEDVSQSWGLKYPSMSNGAAYADLDNDSDLDLIVNNINQPAFIFKNRAIEMGNNHFITIELKGPEDNLKAFGAKIRVSHPTEKTQYHEVYPIKGYASSVSSRIHIGLGSDTMARSVDIIWPDGKVSHVTGLSCDTIHLLTYQGLEKHSLSRISLDSKKAYTNYTTHSGVDFRHRENTHVDFHLEPMLPHLYDHFGPGIAVGDVNSDSREDFYIGGARGQSGSLFLQQANKTFQEDTLPGSRFFEDLGALLFDVDQDEDLDLYVVSGGSSVKYVHQGHYQDRLYLNDGKGNFTIDSTALPEMQTSGSCVVAGDYDLDGDLDLFVGGRIIPGKFPLIPRSYILENDGGIFRDVTALVAPELVKPGLICSALWTDWDNDQDLDLILAGEWMPLRLYVNEQGRFKETTDKSGLADYKGWWNSLTGLDYDQDGDMDYLAGNLGHNHVYQEQQGDQVSVYAKDFDQDGSMDVLMTRKYDGKEYLIAPRDLAIKQMQVMRKIFPRYRDYAKADIHDILSYFESDSMIVMEANYFSSSLIENQGNGIFQVKPLGDEMQMAPIYGMDITQHGPPNAIQFLAVGNMYHTEVIGGRYDAGIGWVANVYQNGRVEYMPARDTGFMVPGDSRALTHIILDKDILHIATRNDQMPCLMVHENRGVMQIPLQSQESYAISTLADGSRQKTEFYYGQGYLSQSSRMLNISPGVRKVQICRLDGKCREIPFSVK